MHLGSLGRSLGVVASAALWTVAFAQDVIIEDVYVDHVSTVPASAGEQVQLFARRYTSGSAEAGAVIMPSSGTLPSDAGFGLDLEGYDHFSYLAEAGFDVFAADVTGYGFSPRPMMDDPCNVDPETQANLLVPNPLDEPCAPSYDRVLTSLFSDWEELDAIVDRVRDLSGQERVSMIGWSLGGPRVGGYAVRHPDKVDRLVFIAPVFAPEGPDALPDERLSEGYPIRIGNVQGLANFWSSMAQCENWINDEVVDQLRRQLNEFDPLAAGWGSSPGDLYRAPTYEGGFGNDVNRPGWNRRVVGRISAPTLVLHGSNDALVQNADEFYDALTVAEKLHVEFECATHWLQWERTREAVRETILEFLQTGRVAGQERGVLTVDRQGNFE